MPRVGLTVGASATYFPQDLDTLMVTERLQRDYGATDLRSRSLGPPNAYRAIGMTEASRAHLAYASSTLRKNDFTRVGYSYNPLAASAPAPTGGGRYVHPICGRKTLGYRPHRFRR